MMKTAILNIVRMALADVNHPHPKNPRDIPPDDSEEIRVLDASLAHDYFDPVVWNRRNGLLVSGHVRVPRLLALGFTHADVSVVDYDDATHEARLLAGNDHSGKNNDDKLDALLTSLRTSAVDPVLALLSALPPVAPLPAGDADAEPQIDRAAELNKLWQVKPGDVWQIGPHRLVCGDSATFTPVKSETLFFDPEWDEMTEATVPFRDVLAFTDGQRAGDVIKMFGSPAWIFAWDCGSCWFTPNRPLKKMKLCFWFGDLQTYQADGAHYGDAGKEKTVSNTRGTYQFKPDPRGKHLADVFQKSIVVEHQDQLHSHSKPLDWIRLLIANCTRGTVYDPFAGSGVAMVACQMLGRECQAVEISPGYCAVILDRMQRTFPDLEIKRLDGAL